jgi:phosphotransferase system  glucose/maltose/N-acetylglucosamine-specific IIC component
MALKRLATIAIVFNIVMSLLFLVSSEFVLSSVVSSNEVVSAVGITIDTRYIGPIEYTPTGTHAPLYNYPLFVFIFALIGNVIFVVLLRRENKAELRIKKVLRN